MLIRTDEMRRDLKTIRDKPEISKNPTPEGPALI
jgi:hypothetical protein